MNIRLYAPQDLAGVLRLCEQEKWPSYLEDPARANRALTAPGVTTMVAEEGTVIAGFAQLQSDGEIQAHLSLIAVDPAWRRRGIARALIVAAFRHAGGRRVDLVTDGADRFYENLPNVRMSGFRLYPEYTGPDHDQPGVTWKDGRKVSFG
jgi:ribosomal protein S18 acetylase RimI-like enzyme